MRRPCVLILGFAGLVLTGCARERADVSMDDPTMAAYVELILPTRIELQEHWTKPVSTLASGEADAIEAILTAYDSFGDNTKIVGTLHFELHTRRMASGDRLGARLAFWPIELTTQSALKRYWDPLARFYKFPLQLPDPPLAEGRYILTARLQGPDGSRLTDEYEFTHSPGAAPPATATVPLGD